ncbi:MAG: thioredoxin family protein [Burkholderiaceae bacterium]|nr:thioredoxin family protein [Burkholderiaceae bacterium]
MRALLNLLPLLATLAWQGHALAAGSSLQTPQVRAELVAHAPEGLQPGKPLWLGLKIEHQPHWHSYWKNPGDSGLPTTLAWTLPPGVQAGEIEWPTPRRLPVGPLLNYGYEGRLLLPVALQLPAGWSAPQLDIRLRADWLVCKEVCIPEGGELALRLPVGPAVTAEAPLFEAARAARPRTVPGAQASATVQPDALQLQVSGLPADWRGRELQFLPETGGVIRHAAAVAGQWRDGLWTARVPLDPQRSEAPHQLPAVLVGDGQAAGLQLQVAIEGAWPAPGAPAATAATAATPPATTVATADPAPGLALALLLALAGGLLLNLMPCVFPVLSLKLLDFARHAHDRRAMLAGGLAYSAGVVASFVALAALLLALRAGGEQLGWGFQLQSPAVVAGLAALFTLIALNLAGLFEVGSVLPDRWATARARHPLADSALTGVLAVAVASPCTAPFMGASLGLAVTLPPAQALAVFAALGLGMALPYLLASAWPGLATRLPRPGPWMAQLRGLMAFPMLATVVWLVWVLGQQTGIDGAAALLGLLLALAFVAWAWGSPALGRRARRGLGALALALGGLTLVWAAPSLRQPAPASAAGAVADAGWSPWSAAAVDQALAQGRPVFVDFTAAWCVTCQYNKRTTLADASVLQALRDRQVLLLRADWTRRDAAIAAELQRLGRSGVPVYALHAPGAARPHLLSEIPSVAELRQAVAALPPPP